MPRVNGLGLTGHNVHTLTQKVTVQIPCPIDQTTHTPTTREKQVCGTALCLLYLSAIGIFVWFILR